MKPEPTLALILGYKFYVEHREDDGVYYLVTSPDWPECISQGKTIIGALRNARDCLETAINHREEMGIELPEMGL